METQPQQVTPILEVAWTRFAQLDAASSKRSKSHLRMRRWIAALGVLATLFAILTGIFPKALHWCGLILKIIAHSFASFWHPVSLHIVSKFFSTGDWLVTRAGAEEILKEIYAYRTILQKTPTRRAWLEKRLEEIQRSVFSGMNGELILEPYKGVLPPFPRFSPTYPNSDPGFHDLTGDEYFRFRLEDQLDWHTREVNRRQRERTRLQSLILISGAIGRLPCRLGTSNRFVGGPLCSFHSSIHRLAGITQSGFGGSKLQQSGHGIKYPVRSLEEFGRRRTKSNRVLQNSSFHRRYFVEPKRGIHQSHAGSADGI